MQRITAALIAIGTIAWVAMVVGPVLAQKSDSKVKIKTTATKADADGVQKIALELTIEPKWHLYANPVKNKEFVDAQTTLRLVSKSPLESIRIEYPEGKLYDMMGEKLMAYEGTVVIHATVKRPLADPNPLKLILKVNACNDNSCLLPAEIVVDVP